MKHLQEKGQEFYRHLSKLLSGYDLGRLREALEVSKYTYSRMLNSPNLWTYKQLEILEGLVLETVDWYLELSVLMDEYELGYDGLTLREWKLIEDRIISHQILINHE